MAEVRRASTRDIPAVSGLFLKLVEYLREIGEESRFSKDPKITVGGVMAYVSAKILDPNSCVFVSEREGQPVGFTIGEMHYGPYFLEHPIMGNLAWMYPISVDSKPMSVAFDAWAMERGATARVVMALIKNDRSIKVYRRDGMESVQTCMVKRY